MKNLNTVSIIVAIIAEIVGMFNLHNHAVIIPCVWVILVSVVVFVVSGYISNRNIRMDEMFIYQLNQVPFRQAQRAARQVVLPPAPAHLEDDHCPPIPVHPLSNNKGSASVECAAFIIPILVGAVMALAWRFAAWMRQGFQIADIKVKSRRGSSTLKEMLLIGITAAAGSFLCLVLPTIFG